MRTTCAAYRPPAQRDLLVGVAVLRSGDDDDTGEPAFTELTVQHLRRGAVVAVLRPEHRRAFGAVQLQRIGQPRCQQMGGIGGADQQPGTGVDVVFFRQLALLPFDGQQPLVEHAIAAFVLGHRGCELQPTHRQQDRPVLVQHVEVGLRYNAGGGGPSGQGDPPQQ